ncbi:MAG: hypothetical protein IPM46_00105 [Flavobacteriales bacterium]|nr:hypothetical protein [Flavobacteriales bacterium]
MDAAGKDSCIRHVMSGVNPKVLRVWSFKTPSSLERSHDFLWRHSRAVPESATASASTTAATTKRCW